MTLDDSFSRLLRSFRDYYDVVTEGAEGPFDAQAEFHSHDEQYFISRKLKLSGADSNEYVYMASRVFLDVQELMILDEAAWTCGCSHIVPGPSHRNSDITLIILTERIDEAAAAAVRRIRRWKNYRFTLYGWTAYRAAVFEQSSGRVITNGRGKDLARLAGVMR